MEVLNKMENCDWTYGESALNALKQTIEEAMAKSMIKPGNVEAVSMGIWGMVHGLVSLAIRERFEKLVDTGQDLKAMMLQSVNWLLNSIDLSLRG